MARKWSVRLLAMGALTVALGCHSTPAPIVTTPLLPDTSIPGPPSETLSSKPLTMPPTIAASPSKPIIAAPGAQLPKREDFTPPNIASAPTKPPAPLGPSIAMPDSPALVVPPPDGAPTLASQSRPVEMRKDVTTVPSPRPDIKSLLVTPPGPPAGPDGFAPAPVILPPSPSETYLPPKIVNKPPESPLPMKSGQQFGHAPDYKWIAGVLDRHVKGGYWTLRFADFGSDDEWGGKMRLLDDPRLENFKDGDQLFIQGELLAPRAAASVDGTSYPPYRVNEVRLVGKN